MSPTLRPRLSTSNQVPTAPTALTDSTLTQHQKEELAASKLRSLTYLHDKWLSGVPPTNAEIDSFLTHIETTNALEQRRGELSAEGQKVLDDVKRFFEELRRFVSEKNEGEVLQRFVTESKDAGKIGWRDQGETIKGKVGEVRQKGAKGKGKEVVPDQAVGAPHEAYERAATVARLLVSSPKFRSLLADVISVSQYVLAGVAEKGAQTLRQRGDVVAQNGADGINTQGDSLAPSSVIQPYGNVDTAAHNPAAPHANVSTAAEVPNSRPPTQQEAVNTATNATTAAVPAALEDTHAAQQLHQSAANAAAKTQNAVTSKLSPEAQARALAAKDAVVDTVQNEIPQEKRDEMISKLKDLLRETQQNPEYQDAIEFIWYTLSDLSEKGKQKATEVGNTAQSGDYNQEVHTRVLSAKDNLKLFIERLAGGKSINPLINSLDAVRVILKEDKDLHSLFDRFKQYLWNSLKTPGYVDRQEWKDEGNGQITQIRAILNDKYKPQTETLRREASNFGDALRNDESSRRLAAAGARINQDLFKDADGNFTFKPALLQDFQSVVIPVLTNQIRVIPVPKITVDNPDVFLSLDNIILETQNILPSLIEMEMHNAAVLSFRKGAKTVSEHTITVGVYQIQAKMDDVKFEVRKKKGFPTITDHGLASILLARNGLSIRLSLTFTPTNTKQTIRVTRVQAHIDTLKIRLKNTKHNALYSLVLPMLNSTIKTAITKQIEKTIKDQIGALDGTITQKKVEKARLAREEKERLKREGVENGPQGVKNRLSGVFGTMRRKGVQKKEEAKGTAEANANRVSVDRDNSRVSYEGKSVEAIPTGVKASDGKGGAYTVEQPSFGNVDLHPKPESEVPRPVS
ncbi:hypothetical protein HK097_009795 [Rhizophlyctis rosea]|uniref:Uncharacterized protein n=1 Tax=Rhizophlyctis rosea TaxID=64517 RepID=A0AAD5SB86_9FUNG|nr:hypothetical protein HK097_009795 [Rhizophlyctis rosea]